MNWSRVISPEAMANSRCLMLPKAGDMTVDADVIGRIREDEIRAFVAHQLPIWSSIGQVTANQQMLSKLPKVARCG